jgi:porphobilinogen synthase
MLFPDYRPRRLRQNEAFRRMIRETNLSVDDFILPLFAINGNDVQNPIPSMPGHFQLSIDNLLKTAASAVELGIPAVMLFGIPEAKDPLGTHAYAADGLSSPMCACASIPTTAIVVLLKDKRLIMTPPWIF